jgi:hypothetical protein
MPTAHESIRDRPTNERDNGRRKEELFLATQDPAKARILL